MPGVDIDAFLEVWQRAVKSHQGQVGCVDKRVLKESLREARNNAKREKRLSANAAHYAWADVPVPEDAPTLAHSGATEDY